MATAASRCSVKLCRSPADSRSPITDQPYCSQHLQADLRRCEKSETAVTVRVAHFKKYQAPLRLMQQRLASDLQLLDDNFNELRDALDKCQAQLTAAITKHNDQLMESLMILTELDDFETELKAAKEASDMRQAFLITENMEKSLETLQLDSQLVCMDEETAEVRMAAFPDVNSAVWDAHSWAKAQLNVACLMVEKLDVRDGTDYIKRLFVNAKNEEVQLGGVVSCMAVCSNTSGFALDESANVVRAQEAAEGPDLHQPTVFVAVERTVPSEAEGGAPTTERRIVLTSFGAHVVGNLSCSFHQPIRDLHCDNDRQLLFIAQDHAVIVTDLCGVEQSRITVSDLQDDVQKLRCITGDSDKLFIVADRADGKPVIFGLSKQSREVQLKLSVAGIDQVGEGPRIFVRDRMLFVDDGEKLHIVCSITGMLLSSFPKTEVEIVGLVLDRILFGLVRDSEMQLFSLLSNVRSVPFWTNNFYASFEFARTGPSECLCMSGGSLHSITNEVI